jgi:NDP-sugar pyrophosphorylase family protein
MDVHAGFAEPWNVTLVDTGLDTMTGGRIKRIARFVDDGSPFHMTYGDGLADVDLNALNEYHEKHRRAATVTAILPQGRFGAVEINDDDGRVDGFHEKPEGDGRWVNGGFFILTNAVFDVITGDDCIWEREPLVKLSQSQQLGAFKHRGYWQAMDTLREKEVLEDLGGAETRRGRNGSRKARTNDVEMPALRERSQSKFLQSGYVAVRQLSNRAAGHQRGRKALSFGALSLFQLPSRAAGRIRNAGCNIQQIQLFLILLRYLGGAREEIR